MLTLVQAEREKREEERIRATYQLEKKQVHNTFSLALQPCLHLRDQFQLHSSSPGCMEARISNTETHAFGVLQTKALRGSRRPEVTFEARSARPGGVLNTAYLEAMDNDEYETDDSDADEGPSQRDNLRRRNLDVSPFSLDAASCSRDGLRVLLYSDTLSTAVTAIHPAAVDWVSLSLNNV